MFIADYIILSVSDLLNKAKFKARRGLNELDKIFVPFVEKRFLSLSNAQVDQLFELFEIDDVSLADIINILISSSVFKVLPKRLHRVPIISSASALST